MQTSNVQAVVEESPDLHLTLRPRLFEDDFREITESEINAELTKNNEQIDQIAQDLSYIEEIMQMVGQQIYGQGEDIREVHNNVQTAELNVEIGTEELQEAQRYAEHGRSLTATIFGTLIGGGVAGVVGIAASGAIPVVGAISAVGGAGLGGMVTYYTPKWVKSIFNRSEPSDVDKA